MKYAVTALVGTVLVVSACSNDSGNGINFSAREAAANALIDEVALMTPTGVDMPTAGTATYTGALAMSSTAVDPADTSTATLVGDMTLEADFAAVNPITGSVSNIVGKVGEETVRATGELTVSGAAITDDALAASLDGTLNDGDSDVLFDLTMNGTFKEAQAAAVGGTVTGQSIEAGVATDNWDGNFAAERGDITPPTP